MRSARGSFAVPLAVLVSAVLVVCAAGCGSSSDQTPPGDTVPVAGKGAREGGDGGGCGTPFAGPGDPVSDLGFRSVPDGFSFSNYGNEVGPVNLTAAEMRLLFGDRVCASRAGGGCVLTPAAQKWMQQQNRGMNDGHCEGMAVMSLLLYGGQKGSARDIVNALSEAFDAGPDRETWSLGFYPMSASGAGHAVTPYRIDDRGGNRFAIAIYDNNYPGEELYVEADLNRNSWCYTTPTKPGESPTTYRGTAASRNLCITPSSVRLEPQVCPFCGTVGGKAALRGADGEVAPMREIWLDGDADLLVTDDQGRRIGFVQGEAVNEIPGAEARGIRTGVPHHPVLRIPAGSALTVTVDGAYLDAAGDSDLALIGEGYMLMVEDILLDPGQRDTVEFSGDWSEVLYRTSGYETPRLGIGIETEDADWEFVVRARGESSGQQVRLAVDLENRRLRIEFSAEDGSSDYDIEARRITEEGEEVFTSSGNSLDDSDTVSLLYGEWEGQGAAMTAGLDDDGDGVEDWTAHLEDEE